MKVDDIHIEKLVEKARTELSSNKKISPSFKALVELLLIVISALLQRLNLDSSNSGLPPSSDKIPKGSVKKKVPKKRGQKSGKGVGGQKGHSGATLKQFSNPDKTVELPIDRRTLPRNVNFKSDGFESRQVVDVVLSSVVTEYRAEALVDKDGNRYVANFPSHMSKAIQYGSSVRSLSTYLSQYQLLPYNRVQEIFKNCFGLPISSGSIYSFNKESYEHLSFFEEESKDFLRKAKFVHADETGSQIEDKLNWIHVLCTPKITYLYPHKKRGQEAMEAMGVLSEFKGVLCHDHWKSYFNMSEEHSLCNAHHLRELQWVIDFKEQKWARSMKRFLIKTKDMVLASGGVLSAEDQSKRLKVYRRIISSGKKECPLAIRAKDSPKGRLKQTKERNLLDRLDNYKDAVLLFMRRKDIPFTNNQAERDLRMVKVHQKISGCFRSMDGSRYFCRIRGYLLTQKKNGLSPFTAMSDVFQNNAA